MKSLITKLRSEWKYFLESDQGIKCELSTSKYTSSFLYPQFGGIVPNKRIHELLQRFYNERVQFIPKDKRKLFNEKFKEAFKTEIKW